MAIAIAFFRSEPAAPRLQGRQVNLAAQPGSRFVPFPANYLLACPLMFGYIFAKSALYVRLPQASLECDFQR
jgi:hypothetical protein